MNFRHCAKLANPPIGSVQPCAAGNDLTMLRQRREDPATHRKRPTDQHPPCGFQSSNQRPVTHETERADRRGLYKRSRLPCGNLRGAEHASEARLSTLVGHDRRLCASPPCIAAAPGDVHTQDSQERMQTNSNLLRMPLKPGTETTLLKRWLLGCEMRLQYRNVFFPGPLWTRSTASSTPLLNGDEPTFNSL